MLDVDAHQRALGEDVTDEWRGRVHRCLGKARSVRKDDQRLLGEERLLVWLIERNRDPTAGLDRRLHEGLGVACHVIAQLDLGLGHGHRSRCIVTQQGEHRTQVPVEVQGPEGLAHLLGRKARELDVIEGKLDRRVTPDRSDRAADARILRMLADALPHLALDLVGMLEHIVERAPFGEQLGGGLLANAGNTGDVITRIALEAEEVGNEARRDAVALHDLFRRVDDHVGHALARGHDACRLTRELVGVLVARDEVDAIAVCLAACRHGAQNVVALVAIHRDARDVHRLEQTTNDGELHGEGLVHGGTLCLVRLEPLHAPVGTMHVPGADDGVGMIILDHLQKHLHEAEDSVGRRAVGRVHGRLDGVKRAMKQGVSVNDGNRSIRHGQPFGRGARTVSP